MTPSTGRMVGGLSGSPIAFLIPIVLTIILLLRNPISFNHKKLWTFTGIMFCWSLAVCYKFHDFSSSNESYYFFLFYSIFIAYIHIRVFGRDLFHIYEHIMVVFSSISLVFWGVSTLLPFLNGFFLDFPSTANDGHNVLYLFHWINSNRNSGCSWEPGRFAIMLIPAIFINLSRRGISFRNNKKIIILLLALASTMSTTGYSIVILLYSVFWLEKTTVKKALSFIVILLPIIIYVFSFDFMQEKIEDRADFQGLTEKRMKQMEYIEEKNRDAYVGSLDRFESMSFEWMNFQKEPLLGYGRNVKHSWFNQEISQNFVLTGGIVKILGQYGLIIGLLLYAILFYSSFKISRLFTHKISIALALTILLSSVSYPIFTVPIFTAFWLYGLFDKDEQRGQMTLNVKDTR